MIQHKIDRAPEGATETQTNPLRYSLELLQSTEHIQEHLGKEPGFWTNLLSFGKKRAEWIQTREQLLQSTPVLLKALKRHLPNPREGPVLDNDKSIQRVSMIEDILQGRHDMNTAQLRPPAHRLFTLALMEDVEPVYYIEFAKTLALGGREEELIEAHAYAHSIVVMLDAIQSGLPEDDRRFFPIRNRLVHFCRDMEGHLSREHLSQVRKRYLS